MSLEIIDALQLREENRTPDSDRRRGENNERYFRLFGEDVPSVVIGKLHETNDAEHDEIGNLPCPDARVRENTVANRVGKEKDKKHCDVSREKPGIPAFFLQREKVYRNNAQQHRRSQRPDGKTAQPKPVHGKPPFDPSQLK